jgi:putative FmdB family regulatory protein
MPIYAYRCDHCGARKDVLQKVSDAALTRCTECGAEAFHKELTAPAFQLKGTGWYATDFRDNGKTKDKPAADTAKEGSTPAQAAPGAAPAAESPAVPAPAAAAAPKAGTAAPKGGTAAPAAAG